MNPCPCGCFADTDKECTCCVAWLAATRKRFLRLFFLRLRSGQASDRIDTLQEAVKTSKPKGTKAHTWLAQREVKALVDACQNGIIGQRNNVVMGLLVTAGLRRE